MVFCILTLAINISCKTDTLKSVATNWWEKQDQDHKQQLKTLSINEQIAGIVNM